MKPSQNCLDFIKKEEGVVLHPYKDSAGVPTIGIGTTMYPSGKRVTMKDPAITMEQAEEYLMWEVQNKAKSVHAFTSKIILKQCQFDALVSFAYNAGVGALQNSSLLKTIIANPNDTKPIKVDDINDVSIKKWMVKQNLRAIPIVTYCFALWCKITVDNKKILSEGLIKRRLREAALYYS